MGVEYARYLVPKTRPSPHAIARLIWELQEAEFLPRNDERARHLRDVTVTREGLLVMVKVPAVKGGRPAHREFRLAPFAPTPEQIVATRPLHYRWHIHGHVTDEGRVAWLRYPLVAMPEGDDAYYSIELVVADTLDELEDVFVPDDVDVPFFFAVDCGKDFARVEEHAFVPELRSLVERVLGELRESELYY